MRKYTQWIIFVLPIKMPEKEKEPGIFKTAGRLLKNIVKAGVSGAIGG